MSHLTQSFQGLWHLMTTEESVPLLKIAAAALVEQAEQPGDMAAAVTIGVKAYHALLATTPNMPLEDRHAIPGIFSHAVAHLKTIADELTVQANGTPLGRGNPDLGIADTPAVPGDPSKVEPAANAHKAHKVAAAAVAGAYAVI